MPAFKLGSVIKDVDTGKTYSVFNPPGFIGMGLAGEAAYTLKTSKGKLILVPAQMVESERFAPCNAPRDIIPPSLLWLPNRIADVPNHGSFLVPKYINRVEPGPSKYYRGWQVRIKRAGTYISKFFSDSTKSGKLPIESLREALEYLRTQDLTPYVKEYVSVRPESSVGITGVRIVKKKHSQRDRIETYVEASAIIRGASARRFYVGMEPDYTLEKLRTVIQKAAAYRESERKRIEEMRKADHERRLKDLLSHQSGAI